MSDRDRPKKRDERPEVQITVVGRIKAVGPNKESEALCLHIDLGWMGDMVVIGNIPPDGRDTAPAYVKLKLGKLPRDPETRRSQRSPDLKNDDTDLPRYELADSEWDSSDTELDGVSD